MDSFDLNIEGQEFTRTRLYQAIKSSNSREVLKAIQTGDDVDLLDQEFGSTYLHLVVNVANTSNEDKLVPMIFQLANAGIDVNATDYKQRTALEIAIYRELKELMVALIRVGIDPTEKRYTDIIREGGSPFELELTDTFDKYYPGLWYAVTQNDASTVFMLVHSWCRINVNRYGRTLIEYARQTKKHHDLIQILDDYEVTLEFVHATLAGDEKRMLEFLMDSKSCDASIMDISFQERWSMPLTPRSLRATAISMGHRHVLHLLPEEEGEEEEEVWTECEESRTDEATRVQEELDLDPYESRDPLPDVTRTSNNNTSKKHQRVRFNSDDNSYYDAPERTERVTITPPSGDGALEMEDEWFYYEDPRVSQEYVDAYEGDFSAINFHGSLRNRLDLKHSKNSVSKEYDKNWSSQRKQPPPVPPRRKATKKKIPPTPTPRKTAPPVSPRQNGSASSVVSAKPTPRARLRDTGATAKAKIRDSIKSKTCAIS